MHIYYKLVLIVLTVVNYVVYSGVCFGLIFAQGVFIQSLNEDALCENPADKLPLSAASKCLCPSVLIENVN